MMTKTRLVPDQTLLLIIDVQERLAPAMDPTLKGRLLANLVRLGEAQKALGFQAVLTEQYPEGLGPTLVEVRSAFGEAKVMSKLCFAAGEDDAIGAALRDSGSQSVVVTGMETHICVFQSVRELIGRGKHVVVLADAVASRTRDNFEIGLAMAKEAGATISSTEAVLFDMLGRAGSPAFKTVSRLVR